MKPETWVRCRQTLERCAKTKGEEHYDEENMVAASGDSNGSRNAYRLRWTEK